MTATRHTNEETLHWLALTLAPGLGARKCGQLIDRFRSPVTVFRASVEELERCGVPGSAARSIASGCTFEDAVLQQGRMLECGAEVIPITDERYPRRLREIFDPPVLIFVRGRVELLDTLMIGVVGTRRPTPYGVAAAERLGADLARNGVTVASGMARGIDTAAHRAALSCGGNTIAVFGCGVDQVYPSENRKLAAEIAEKGLLVSEFPMGTPGYPQNFPVRNRIVSGMSAGVVVVEGAQYSGSSITAKLALEQGREVFAVPGNITSKMSWGPNLLIKQGAKLVQDWNDVIEELSPEDRLRLTAASKHRIMGAEAGEQQSISLDPDNHVARAVLGALKPDLAMHLDDLLSNVENVSSSELIAALFDLELLGLVKQLPGRNFIKVW
jgi:DNA processing protein